MKKMTSIAVLALLLAFAGSAQALETRDLVAMAAMPLAVAAVAELTDVPTADLMSLVSTLNNASVPAPQFVEVVRYAPLALVDTREPLFVDYVSTQYESGVSGDALALSIADRYETYGTGEIDFNNPSTFTVVEERDILPQVVVTRFEPVAYDPVALVAMPLAVAVVSEFTDVPRSDLVSMIMALNRGRVAPTQFVEVVRYSPVVLIDRNESPLFLAYVNTQVDRGLIGRPLAFAIGDRLRQSGIEEINVLSPSPLFVDRSSTLVLPQFVETRVVERRSHPHGGPPGQLKKQLGLQTGAEVVHGTKPGRVARTGDDGRRESSRVEKSRTAKPARVEKQRAPKKVAAPRPQKVRTEKSRNVDKVPKVREESRHPRQAATQSRGHGNGNGAKGNAGGGGKNSGKGGKGKGKG